MANRSNPSERRTMSKVVLVLVAGLVVYLLVRDDTQHMSAQDIARLCATETYIQKCTDAFKSSIELMERLQRQYGPDPALWPKGAIGDALGEPRR
jgi:hypothetical protein